MYVYARPISTEYIHTYKYNRMLVFLKNLKTLKTCYVVGMASQVHTYTHIHTYMHAYTHIHTHTYIHTRTHTHTYTQVTYYKRQGDGRCWKLHTHTYIHTYIHTHIHTHTHTYIHTYTHTYRSTEDKRQRWQVLELHYTYIHT